MAPINCSRVFPGQERRLTGPALRKSVHSHERIQGKGEDCRPGLDFLFLVQNRYLVVQEISKGRQPGREKRIYVGVGWANADPVHKQEEDSRRLGHRWGRAVSGPPYWAVRRSMVTFTDR